MALDTSVSLKRCSWIRSCSLTVKAQTKTVNLSDSDLSGYAFRRQVLGKNEIHKVPAQVSELETIYFHTKSYRLSRGQILQSSFGIGHQSSKDQDNFGSTSFLIRRNKGLLNFACRVLFNSLNLSLLFKWNLLKQMVLLNLVIILSFSSCSSDKKRL